MSEKRKIMVFGGSLRKESYNKKLAKAAAAIAEQEGAEVTYLDLKDIPMPIFDEDIESAEGFSDNVKKFRNMMIDHDAFIISTPEYNGYFSGVLKNAVDWASRPEKDHPNYECFLGKTALIMAASPGKFGGVRSLIQLRLLLGSLKIVVFPDQFGLANAAQEFDEHGNLSNKKTIETVSSLVKRFVNFKTSG